jgi:hypothetical protein
MNKTTSPEVNSSSQATGQVNGTETKSPAIADLLRKVDQLLREGQPGKALDLIARAKVRSPWATNAAAVCQLRLGNAKVALDVFRGLVLGAGGLILRADVPIVFKINYATALLAADNLAGCLSVLTEVRDEGHPAAQKLRAAFARWKKGLSLWQRIQWYMGGQPNGRLELDFLPGDLE